ncbi:MAG: hypothetical protein JWN70_3462 [Planctomycetaceae bacterium]|nr:hypothetical protein [Planctomycetaceae bacterium]
MPQEQAKGRDEIPLSIAIRLARGPSSPPPPQSRHILDGFPPATVPIHSLAGYCSVSRNSNRSKGNATLGSDRQPKQFSEETRP